MGRSAGGVRAITLDKDDEVVSMELDSTGERELLVMTKKGFGKRTSLDEYRLQTRGGKGVSTYDKTKFSKTGELVGATLVSKDDEIMLINSNGVIIRIRANEISKSGRTTQGVKIMKVDEGSKIVAIAKAIRDDEDEVEESSASTSNETEEQISL